MIKHFSEYTVKFPNISEIQNFTIRVSQIDWHFSNSNTVPLIKSSLLINQFLLELKYVLPIWNVIIQPIPCFININLFYSWVINVCKSAAFNASVQINEFNCSTPSATALLGRLVLNSETLLPPI